MQATTATQQRSSSPPGHGLNVKRSLQLSAKYWQTHRSGGPGTLDQRWVEYPVHFHCDCLGSSFLMLITLDQQWTCYHGPEVSLISCTLLFRLPWIRGGLGALYKLHCDYPGPSISSSIILDQRWVWYPEQFHFNHRGTGNCSISLILNHHNLDFIVTLVDNIRIRSTRADR